MQKSKKNIVLFGFMGTGKTTVGRLLAERYDRIFLDMDDVIEQREGRTIADIFETNGEIWFRQYEAGLVEELSLGVSQVISTGGGVALNPENVNGFASSGPCVCLRASAETISERVAAQTHRPLLEQKDREKRIRSLLKERKSAYDAIPYQIETDGLSPEQVAEKIADLFEARAAK